MGLLDGGRHFVVVKQPTRTIPRHHEHRGKLGPVTDRRDVAIGEIAQMAWVREQNQLYLHRQAGLLPKSLAPFATTFRGEHDFIPAPADSLVNNLGHSRLGM